MPFFSILIPCYNGAKTLAATLDSVAVQTFRDFEVVIVNDGSTDESPQIIETYADKLPINVIHQENAGLGAARNAGIRNSTGEFVAFLDADDLWLENKLERVYDLVNKLNGGVDVICHSEDMQRDGVSLQILKHGPNTTYSDLLFKGNTLSPSATCVRRTMLVEVGLFSLDKKGHGAEDWDLWLKLAKHNARIRYIEEVLGIYVMYGENMSETPDFHEKGRYVFESHVSRLNPVTPELLKRIKGARAIYQLYSAKSQVAHGQYSDAAATAWSGLYTGGFNAFFWSQICDRSFSRFKRTVS